MVKLCNCYYSLVGPDREYVNKGLKWHVTCNFLMIRLHTVYPGAYTNTEHCLSNKTDKHIPSGSFSPLVHPSLPFISPLNSRDGGNDYTMFSNFLFSSLPCVCREPLIQSTSHSKLYLPGSYAIHLPAFNFIECPAVKLYETQK